MKNAKKLRLASQRARNGIECGFLVFGGFLLAAIGLLKVPSRSFAWRKRRRAVPGIFGLATLALLSGCLWGGDDAPSTPTTGPTPPQAEIIDLQKVITALSETLDELDVAAIKTASDEQLKEMASVPAGQGREDRIVAKRLSPQEREQFIAKFSERLTKVQPLKKVLGVLFDQDGMVKGFCDDNRNKIMDGNETEVFGIFIDPQRTRLIASDGHSKDPHFRDFLYDDFIPGTFTHALLGSMRSDQMDKSVDTTNFAGIKLSPKDYHNKLSQPPPAPQPTPAAK